MPRDKANLTRWQREYYVERRKDPAFRARQSAYSLKYYYKHRLVILAKKAKKDVKDEEEITSERIERMKREIKEERLARMAG